MSKNKGFYWDVGVLRERRESDNGSWGVARSGVIRIGGGERLGWTKALSEEKRVVWSEDMKDEEVRPAGRDCRTERRVYRV